jgi:hypothetical protein
MNFEDCMQPPPYIETEPWQLGSLLTSEIEAGTVVLIFVSDCRGSGYDAESVSFLRLRKKLYRLSQSDFKLRICDLGDLISGNSLQDTHFILQQTRNPNKNNLFFFQSKHFIVTRNCKKQEDNDKNRM